MAGKNEIAEGRPVVNYDEPKYGKLSPKVDEALKSDARSEAEVEKETLTPEHAEFNALIRGLSARIAGMQLRPEDTRKFNEDLEELKEKSGHRKEVRPR